MHFGVLVQAGASLNVVTDSGVSLKDHAALSLRGIFLT